MLAGALGISTCAASVSGLPLSLLSAFTNSSVYFSIVSANFINISERFCFGVLLQVLKASLAASTALSISCFSESGIKEYTSPFDGLKLSK